MHRVFVSDGVVLGKRGVGEANTLAAILTREMGLVKASARAGRREDSKLRYGLEPLSSGTFSFIRGRHEWKLTGAQDVTRALLAKDLKRRQASGRIAKLLLRLIHGEETNVALYETVREGLQALTRVDEAHIENIEAVLVLRVLAHLGYLPKIPELQKFITQNFFSIELAGEIAASRVLLIRAINESLGATGL
jgi:DNA repair protein RecO (recombination protein O)